MARVALVPRVAATFGHSALPSFICNLQFQLMMWVHFFFLHNNALESELNLLLLFTLCEGGVPSKCFGTFNPLEYVLFVWGIIASCWCSLRCLCVSVLTQSQGLWRFGCGDDSPRTFLDRNLSHSLPVFANALLALLHWFTLYYASIDSICANVTCSLLRSEFICQTLSRQNVCEF